MMSRWCSACGVLLLAAGCSQPVFEVQGQVRLDDQPLPEAYVTFLAQDDDRGYGYAWTDAEGRYSIRQTESVAGLPPGMYTVRVSTFRDAEEESGATEPIAPERLPDCYHRQTTLEVEIQPGKNRWDFPLTSDCTGQPQPGAAE